MKTDILAPIRGLIFGVLFLLVWQISGIKLGLLGVAIFFVIVILATASVSIATLIEIKIIILAIFILLVVFLPILHLFAYNIGRVEDFDDNKISKGYSISGDCRIQQRALFVDGDCKISKRIKIKNPWISFKVISGRGTIYTTFVDNGPTEVGYRDINFYPISVSATLPREYYARIEWVREKKRYCPVAYLGEEGVISSCLLREPKEREFTVVVKIRGKLIIDDLESPYGAVKWKLNPFSK